MKFDLYPNNLFATGQIIHGEAYNTLKARVGVRISFYLRHVDFEAQDGINKPEMSSIMLDLQSSLQIRIDICS